MSIASAESRSDPALPVLQQQMEEFRRLLGPFTGVRLPSIPTFGSVGEVKQFCEGLLDPGTPHTWRAESRGWGPTQSASLQHSLFLARKIVPAQGCPIQKSKEYVRRMSLPSPATDPGFLEFCAQEIPLLFKSGWDRSYASRVSGMTLTTSACLENPRSKGGARAIGSADYCREVALGMLLPPDPKPVRVQGIVDGCKHRVVSCGSWEEGFLSPLHNTVYDHLSRQDWLIRGDARPRCFPSFTSVRGEVFVSGDYEAATDNLSLQVYQELLRLVSLTSKNVPASVWEAALRFSERDLFVEGDESVFRQRRGQLMGSFLSFPFLCLVNYLCFRWVVGPSAPVAVNGDDIVFRARPSVAEKWMGAVAAAGLTLSKGKTSVDGRFFTLNSALFSASEVSVRAVPFLRAKCLFKRPTSVSAFCGQWKALCAGCPGSRRRLVQVAFLKRCRGAIDGSRRSLTRGLGLRVPVSVLRMAGLFKREMFYLSFPKEKALPLVRPEVSYLSVPLGWARCPLSSLTRSNREKARTEERTCFFPALIAKSRVCDPVTSRSVYWDLVKEGCWSYAPVVLTKGLHRSWQRLCAVLGSRTVNPEPNPPPSSAGVWVRREELLQVGNAGLGWV